MSDVFKGVDVSEHNGAIDWAKVKATGIDFAMLRAGYGQNNIDKRFKYNISECNRLGIPCGVYWFSYAFNPTMALKEAEYCLAAVKPYKLEYPIAFDFEYDSVRYAKDKGVTINKTLASSLVNIFCGKIEAGGYYALNYANKDYLTNFFSANRFGLWLATWNNNENPPLACSIWQYSSTGKVNGISGSVDMNKGYVDFPTVIRNSGMNGLKKDWKEEAIEWAVKNGISDGSNPNEPATRVQVLSMLKRYHDKFGK